MTTLTPGDVVRLKSGGPKMTVLESGGEIAICKWFDRNGKLHSESFAVALLEAFIARPKPAAIPEQNSAAS